MNVRHRTEDDLEASVAALRLVHDADGYPSSWPADAAAWLTPSGLLAAWVALEGSTVVGHVALAGVDDREDPQIAAAARRRPEELAEIKRLFVVPAARGAGVALTLLELAARYAFSLELHPVLETTADREPAIRFYERNGWRRIGTSIALWTRVSGERPTLHQYEPRPSTFGEHTARDGIMR